MVIDSACGAARDEGSKVIYVTAISAWFTVHHRVLAHHFRDSWGELLPCGSIAGVIYYSGHCLDGFHMLTDDDEVLVYVLCAPTTRLVTYRFPTYKVTLYAISRCLVRYADELLVVARVVTTKAFRFARLVPEKDGERQASWFPMPVVPTGIIVLWRCCSRFYPTFGIDFDGVYFLDDLTSSQGATTRALEPAATRQYP